MKTEIKNVIKAYDKELKLYKEQLTNMVPYRALAGFFNKSAEPADWSSTRRMVAYIQRVNQISLLPYTLFLYFFKYTFRFIYCSKVFATYHTNLFLNP